MQDTDIFAHIKGWGVDADPRNEPTYPMKKYTGDDHLRLNYTRPSQQPVTTEILHSNERPNVSAVFGTPLPPKGISGSLRRWAFRFSEGQIRHWLLLLAADRVNMVEGVVEDFAKGHIPNVPAEMGLNAAWKYNRKKLLMKAAVTTVVVTSLVLLCSGKGKKHSR